MVRVQEGTVSIVLRQLLICSLYKDKFNVNLKRMNKLFSEQHNFFIVLVRATKDFNANNFIHI